MKKLKYILQFAIILYFLPIVSFAQYEGNVWYFGQQAGIDFSTGRPVPILDSQMEAKEGCAVISDPEGKLLFYTNGETVWNKNHQILLNGNNLRGGQGSSQSSLILRNPGKINEYYLFTVDDDNGEYGLRYSIINMEFENGLGGISAEEKNIFLAKNVSEKITAVKTDNGDSFWIIAHEFGTNRFFTYQLNKYGINSAAVVSEVGVAHSPTQLNEPGIALGCMKASLKGNKLALAIQYKNLFEVFDFDKKTGKLSHPVTFSDYLFAYGVEFSPNEKFLYGTRRYATKVYQWDLEAEDIASSVEEVGTSLGSNGALQLGPLGNIYLTCRDKEYLGMIQNPNKKGISSEFVKEGVYLGGRKAQEGLPNFVPLFYIDPGFKSSGHCQGDTLLFKMNNKTLIDSIYWSFDEGYSYSRNYTAARDTFCVFNEAGNYRVKLITYSLKGTVNFSEKIITIQPLPEIDLGKDISACEYSLPVLDAGIGNNRSYLWNNSENDRFLNVQNSGSYTLRVSENSCYSFDTINVTINKRPQVIDATVKDTDCNKNNGLISLSVEGDIDKHYFTWGGVDVDYHGPELQNLSAGNYPVKIEHENGCFNKLDTLRIQEFGIPEMEVNVENDLVCMGEIVKLKALNAEHYIWSTGETTEEISITANSSKEYWVKGINKNGCYKIEYVNINVYPTPALTFSDKIMACEGDTIWLDAGNNNISVLWSDSSTNRYLPVSGSGAYSLKINDQYACNYERKAEFVFNKNPEPDLGPDQSFCFGLETELDAGEWQSYQWNSGERSRTIKTGSSGIYEIVVTDENKCSGRDQISINVPPKLSVVSHIKEPGGINTNDGVIRISVKGGEPPYTYLWSDFETCAIKENVSEGIYSVRVTDANNCSEILKSEIVAGAGNYLEIPTAFTPNGDGINDLWLIKNSELYPAIKVLVYNSSGQEVYNSRGYTDPWNGRSRGSLLPTNTYYYFIDLANGMERLSGSVTIIL
ncbi:gliding motility-associated C-terminal domain-containing protein [Bacteroidota bacterium]